MATGNGTPTVQALSSALAVSIAQHVGGANNQSSSASFSSSQTAPAVQPSSGSAAGGTSRYIRCQTFVHNLWLLINVNFFAAQQGPRAAVEVRAASLVGTLTNLSLLAVRHVACILFRRRASFILPSFLKRKGEERSSKAKKAKTPWDRDIVCLPNSLMEKNKYIPFPRGKTRALLACNGLIGKLHISSEMSESDVFGEMRSVFKGAMQGDPNFPFKLLQPTGEGSRSPPISDTFHWTAQQVSKLFIIIISALQHR